MISFTLFHWSNDYVNLVGIMDIKSGALSTTPVSLTPNSKGDLTFSAHTFHPKPQKVKATVANVPLATSMGDSESTNKADSKHGMRLVLDFANDFEVAEVKKSLIGFLFDRQWRLCKWQCQAAKVL